jgi:diguanylate cyclase (GGDEF)-like protein
MMGSSMLVHELLDQKITSEVDLVSPDAKLLELASLLSQKSIGSVVVTNKEGDMLGIITEKDIVKTVGQAYEDVPNTCAGDIMSTNIITCSSTDNISDVLDRMKSRNIRHMPVVDNGKLITVIGMRDVQAICRQLGELATTDPLTGLSNRRAFERVIETEYNRFQRHNTLFSVASMDIDFFKKINDTHGHAAGDMVLVKFAQLLKSQLRAYDFSARVGGEEFSLIFPNTELNDAITVCDKLSDAIRDIELFNDTGTIRCTASFGVTTVNSAFTNIDDMLNFADQLLYDAKVQGRNRIVAETIKSDSGSDNYVQNNDLDNILFD